MLDKSDGKRCTAIFLAVLLLLSTISGVPVAAETIDGGSTSVANAGPAPSIDLSNATINDSTKSTVQLAYNATGAIDTNDIKIRISGPGHYAFTNTTTNYGINTTIDSSEGVINATIPAEAFGGGNHTLQATLVDESTGTPVASDSNTLAVTTPVALEDYSVSNTTAYTGENVTVSTVLNNTARESQNFTVAVYGDSFAITDQSVTLSAGETRTVDLNVTFSRTGTYNITVNTEPPREITVEPPVTVTETTVSNTSPFTYQNVTVNATVVNRGETTAERSISLYRNGFPTDRQSISLAPGESANLTFNTYLSYPSTFEFQVGDGKVKSVTAERNPVVVQHTSVNESSVALGDTVEAEITLENTGSDQTDRIVEFKNGYRIVDTRTVTPAGGETVTTSFNQTFNIGGVYHIAGDINGDNQKVTVSDPAVTIENYSVSSTTVYERDSVYLNVTVNNTADTRKQFHLSAWDLSGFQNGKYIQLAAGEQKQVTIETSFYQTGDHNITVNNEPATTVTVQEAISVKDVTVSKRVLEKNETSQVNVTLHNPTDSDRSRYVSVWTGESQGKTVGVRAGATRTVSFNVSYSESGRHTLFVAGQRKHVAVLNDTEGTANISIERTFPPNGVVNNSTAFFFAEAVNTGNASGVQNVTLSINGTVVDSTLIYADANSTAQIFLQNRFTEKGDYTGYINGTDSHKVNGTVRGPVVDDSTVTVTHVNGTQPSEMPNIKPVFRGNSISIQINADEYNRDLSDVGADKSTVFQINFTVQNYTPRVMASTGQNLTWTTTDVGENRTEVSIRVSPSQLDFKTDFDGERPTSPAQWDSSVKNDTADFGYDAAILMALGNAQGEFFDADAADLAGMTISTDAQLFTMPRYYPGDENEQPRLEIGLAAPHKTVNGNVNDGFYRAFIPNSLLNSWNVSDPESQLTAAYSGSDTNITVTEVQDGAYVTLSLHYSSGTVTVSKDVRDTTSDTEDSSTSDSTTGDTDYSGTSDSDSSTTSDASDSDSTDSSVNSESVTTETSTVRPTDTPTPTQTQTPTATATAEPTPTSTATPAPTVTAAQTETATERETTSTEPTPTETEVSTPGFGAAVTLLALIAAGLLAVRRE